MRSDCNLTLLESNLGFILRSFPVVFDNIFVPDYKLDDTIIRIAIDQRRNERLRVETFFRSVSCLRSKLKFNYSLLKELKTKFLFKYNLLLF